MCWVLIPVFPSRVSDSMLFQAFFFSLFSVTFSCFFMSLWRSDSLTGLKENRGAGNMNKNPSKVEDEIEIKNGVLEQSLRGSGWELKAQNPRNLINFQSLYSFSDLNS